MSMDIVTEDDDGRGELVLRMHRLSAAWLGVQMDLCENAHQSAQQSVCRTFKFKIHGTLLLKDRTQRKQINASQW